MNILKKCYDAAAGFYGRDTDVFWKDRFGWLRKTIRDTLEMSRLSIERGARVLDLGCGPGIASEEFLKLYPQTGELTGVDLSPRMGRQARRTLGDRFTFCCGDYTKSALWQTMPGKFQGILAFYTFHWTPANEYAFVIERISEALEKGGWLLGIAMGPGELAGIFNDIIPEILQIYLPPRDVPSKLDRWNPKDVADIERPFSDGLFCRTRTISLRYSISYPSHKDLVSIILYQYNFWLAELDPALFPSVREKLQQSVARDPRFRGPDGAIQAPHHIVVFEARKP
ncbi:class I SAM-dependent methyltransferase [candidate division WOR-3 bacterium]|nr:class I SAM-dependent methyltransferase [candidate division WOR-3 bacterium]